MKACDIVKRKYWSHKDPDGVESWYMFDLAGYKYVYAGENLAKDFYSDYQAMRALMRSPTHRENILMREYTNVGIGRCGNITVQHFGRE